MASHSQVRWLKVRGRGHDKPRLMVAAIAIYFPGGIDVMQVDLLNVEKFEQVQVSLEPLDNPTR